MGTVGGDGNGLCCDGSAARRAPKDWRWYNKCAALNKHIVARETHLVRCCDAMLCDDASDAHGSQYTSTMREATLMCTERNNAQRLRTSKCAVFFLLVAVCVFVCARKDIGGGGSDQITHIIRLLVVYGPAHDER